MVYDSIRNKKLVDSPEEKVRQYIIKLLIEEYKYQKCLFRVERNIPNYEKNRFRPDIVIYNRSCEIFMIVECKAKNVSINENSFFQLMKYNRFFNARYLLLTNGSKTYCWKLENNKYVECNIPNFE